MDGFIAAHNSECAVALTRRTAVGGFGQSRPTGRDVVRSGVNLGNGLEDWPTEVRGSLPSWRC